MRPAARIVDIADCHGTPVSVPTIPWPMAVLISGVPAARYLDKCACGAFVVTGDPTVLICGLPAVRLQDRTNHGGAIALGDPRTLLGEQVFEDPDINTILKRLERARQRADQAARDLAEERRVLEDFERQHREESFRPPTQDSTGLPQSPQGAHGSRLGFGAARLYQARRVRQFERREQAAQGEVRAIEQELTSETNRRFGL